MATYTKNYNLKKPAYDDFSDIADLNGNADIIDETLKNKADLGSDGKVSSSQLPAMDYIPTSQKGSAGGVASLGANGKVPSGQLPAMDYIPSSQKGATSGVASLGADGKVPSSQLPAMDYIPTSQKGAAGGVATLGANKKVPAAQIPTLDYIPASQKGAAEGVATLGSDGKVSSSQLPAMDYIPTSQKGAAEGVATLGSDGKVSSSQLPAMDYIPTSQKGAAEGVATLGANRKVPVAQIPTLDYIPTSQKGAAGGVATLGSDGKIPDSLFGAGTFSSLTTKGEVEIYGDQPHLDFHFGNSDDDYTTRIIETASGKLNFSAPNGVLINGTTINPSKLATESITLSVISKRLTDLSYTAKYCALLGAVFVRIYGKIAADMNTGYDYDVLNIGSRKPNYIAALATKTGKLIAACAKSEGVISLRPMTDNITASAGWDIYITGFWFV